MAEPFVDDVKPNARRKSGANVNRSLTGRQQKENSMMLGLNAKDFDQRDNSEMPGRPSRKAKNQDDNLLTTGGTGGGHRPGSGGRARGRRDEERTDLRRTKTSAHKAQPRRSIFVGGTSKKVNFGDELDPLGERDKDASSDRGLPDSDDDLGVGKDNGARMDLAGYNARRKERLRPFDFSMDASED